MKLYIVSSGSYSDYHILGIFSTSEKAEEAKVLYNADNDVEDDWELDKIPDHPPGLLPYSVLIDRGGYAEPSREGMGGGARDFSWAPYGDGAGVVMYMWAADEQHAVKIANERRVELIASNEWTTDWHEWRRAWASLEDDHDH